MEKVKSRAINMMYGISKIHTNVEFNFSNNNLYHNASISLDDYFIRCIIALQRMLDYFCDII